MLLISSTWYIITVVYSDLLAFGAVYQLSVLNPKQVISLANHKAHNTANQYKLKVNTSM